MSEFPQEVMDRINKARESGATRLDLDGEVTGVKLTSLPPEIGQLTGLQTLNLESNQLSTLPSEIVQLTGLQKLLLAFNQLSTLPPEIGQLTSLQSLDLDGNQLSSLPPEIGQLTSLQTLNLHSNQLSDLPPEIVQLTGLQRLYLSGNQFSTLHLEIGQLTSLQELNLRNNQLSSLPPEIGQLTSLKRLSLMYNQLSTLPPEIGQLTCLEELFLEGNQLSMVPLVIWQLTNLKTLDLEDLQLRVLPPEIGKLTSLDTLYLKGNQLSSLPKEITNLPDEMTLYVGGMNLESPPQEVAEKGIPAIREYFRQLDEEGGETLREAKLLIVGEGGAGKTTLARKLFDIHCELPNEDESTRGIDIAVKPWYFPPESTTQFRANLWDFGGQHIYHATHQFFLTRRSVYALVVEPRKEHTDVYYWLNIIQILGGDSPVLLVKNEKGDRPVQLNEASYHKHFSHLVKPSYPVNFKTVRGLPKLSAALQQHLQALPHTRDTLPATWKRVRDILTDESRDTISRDEFLTICREQGIKRTDDALQLSQYLHDIGVILHFENVLALRHLVILNSSWATDAVFRLLDRRQVYDKGGEFNGDDMAQIWSEEKYCHLRPELLALMLKFRICYPLDEKANRYLAPQQLPIPRPEYEWDTTNDRTLVYDYEFMPKGLISQLIVLMHARITDRRRMWRYGVVLEFGDARVEVIEFHEAEQITLRAQGDRARDALTRVQHVIDGIHRQFPGIQVTRIIPCNCSRCGELSEQRRKLEIKHDGLDEGSTAVREVRRELEAVEKPHHFNYANLERRLQHRRDTIECEISYEPISIRSLLDDVMNDELYTQLKEDREGETKDDGKMNETASGIHHHYGDGSQVNHTTVTGDSASLQQQTQRDQGIFNNPSPMDEPSTESPSSDSVNRGTTPQKPPAPWAIALTYVFVLGAVAAIYLGIRQTLDWWEAGTVILLSACVMLLVSFIDLRGRNALGEKAFVESVKNVLDVMKGSVSKTDSD